MKIILKNFENELKVRKENNLPPYTRFLSLIISSQSKNDSYQGALEIKKKISKLSNLDILGPVESPISRDKKKYRTRLLIRTESKNMYQRNLSKILENLKISSKIKLTVDVDQ